MKRVLYHISPKENRESILKNGLKVNEAGQLFLFEWKDIDYPYFLEHSDDGTFSMSTHNIGIDRLIAVGQLGLYNYDIYSVTVEGRWLKEDNVAEFTASSHRIYPYNVLPSNVRLYKEVSIKNEKKIWE